MDTKVCSKCKSVKLIEEFSKRRASKDGYESKCKVCKKEYDAKHGAEYYAANPEKNRERQAKVCGKCKEVKVLSEFNKRKASKDGYCSHCKVCVKEYDAKCYAANPEKEKKRKSEYYAANPEKRKERDAKYQKANPEKVKKYQAEYHKANPEKRRAWCSNRRAAKLEAIPSWLTEEDWQAMEAINEEADRLTRETGIKHEVDHIIPLQPPKVAMFEGEMIPLVCAFHCPQNLQILTRYENRSKKNKFTPYVESA